MLDLLRLDGVEPTDFRRTDEGLVIDATTIDPAQRHCPDCGAVLYRHGRRTNTFADTPIDMLPVRIEISRQRYRCGKCKKTIVPELPFLDDKRLATSRLIEAINLRCLHTTFSHLSEETGLALNTIKNITNDLVSDLEANVKFETPVIMGIDELNVAGGMRGIITNLSSKTVFDLLETRKQDLLKPYFSALPDRDRVKWVCTDMWRPFKRSFEPYFPNARRVIDKFHVVRMASEALEIERKKYQKHLSKDARLYIKQSVHWLTLKRPASLSPKEAIALAIVKRDIPALGHAYDLKEYFYCIYDEPDKASAMRAFEAWANSVPKEMKDFFSLIDTVQRHYDDIFAYWDTPHAITNAYNECQNGIIKVANRMGRGYSFEVIRAKILYAKLARQVGSEVSMDPISLDDVDLVNHSFNGFISPASVKSRSKRRVVEYGPHIPTLVEMAEHGNFE